MTAGRDRSMRLLLVAVSGLLLGGCAGMMSQTGSGVPVIDGAAGTRDEIPAGGPAASVPPPVQSGTRQPYPAPLPVVPPTAPAPGAPASSPAVMALLNTSEKERAAGRYEHAAAAIERAVGIEPRNALLWSRLAAIRLDQQNWQQANVMAGRSNSLARNDRKLQLQNWRIIAQAKARMGDSAGAAAARRMILQLGGDS